MRWWSWKIQWPLPASSSSRPTHCRLSKSSGRHWCGRKGKWNSSPNKELASLSTLWPRAPSLVRAAERERMMLLLFPILAGGRQGKGGKDVWFWCHPLYIQEKTVRNVNQEKKRSDLVLIYFRMGFVFNFFSPFFALCSATSLPEARTFSDTHPCYPFSFTVALPSLSKVTKAI